MPQPAAHMSREGTCQDPTCDSPIYSRGYCTAHYQRMRRRGTTAPARKSALNWERIVDRAAEIVGGYEIMVTLRQVFYRLVAEGTIPNRDPVYNRLSQLTAERRRAGTFPPLHETGRSIRLYASWADAESRLDHAVATYRIDRTIGQPKTIVLGVEKNALAGLLLDWFGDLGIPVVPLGGQASETIERRVRAVVRRYDRPATLIYAGDFDASGLNIEDVFLSHTDDCWADTKRIALDEDQAMALPINPGNPKDTKAPAFVLAHPRIHELAIERGVIPRWTEIKFRGRAPQQVRMPVQVELDAVEPRELRQMYRGAIDEWWDEDAYMTVQVREDLEAYRLRVLRNRL